MESREFSEKRILTEEELTKQLDILVLNQASNQQIEDWVEVCDKTAWVDQEKDLVTIMIFYFHPGFFSG